MTDIDLKHNKHKPGDEIEKAPSTEAIWQERFNDMKGKLCRVQPRDGEIPHLESGRHTKGCEYKTFSALDKNSDSIDIPSLYKHGHSMAVYIQARTREPGHRSDSFGSGSGVIVGKRNGNELLILTANHVVGGEVKGEKLKEVETRTFDGDIEEGKVVDRLPKEDLALIAVKKDPAQMSKYEVAVAIKSLSELHKGDKALGVGFPSLSESVYASPGYLSSIKAEQDLGECTPKNCYGEDWSRPLIHMRMHSKGGNSGNGVWNTSGRVIGVLNGSNEDDIRYSDLNPVTQSKIDNMIRRAKPFDKS